ncbi:phosphatidylserine decarboxylase, partial [Acinetobacter baumannii]
MICPADGKVVVIEEVVDEEYFKDKRIQVSIFMSPANVHVNRNPMDGVVTYNQYHKGKYLVAWHPKS